MSEKFFIKITKFSSTMENAQKQMRNYKNTDKFMTDENESKTITNYGYNSFKHSDIDKETRNKINEYETPIYSGIAFVNENKLFYKDKINNKWKCLTNDFKEFSSKLIKGTKDTYYGVTDNGYGNKNYYIKKVDNEFYKYKKKK